METTPATGMLAASWLLIALPLAGAAVLLLGGRRTDRWGHLLGTGTVVAAFVVGLVCTVQLAGLDERSASVDLFTFIRTGNLDVEAGLLFDPLSAVFVLLITGVGALIHVYSIGYMAHDPARRRFFAYLNLFVAAMLLLVLGNSYVALYVGWEGVGLASYLLIAFWYTRPAAATAAKKAFIMNRVGDVGLALAIFLMFAQLGTTSYAGVFGQVGLLAGGTVTAMGLLLLLGACGKSGQFPLQAWLPDAMEGPTPVSALIHAATMVTAGVYLIARSAPVFDETATARTVVLVIGAITLMIGAIVGCAYDDIKKVLAYSTVSQIGYMFLAVGLGPVGYAAGIAHLLAHGFFKAGLFLGAGSVMHAMNDSVDMRRYGGLARKLPITFVTFGLGYLALIGFPLLSGWWTKDAIIEAALNRGGASGWLLGGVAVLGAGLTAFYMTRLMLMTFFGRARWEDGVHPHESPPVMTAPMVVLAVGSVLAGFVLVQAFPLETWLAPVFGEPEEAAHVVAPLTVGIVVFVVMALGIGAAWLFVGRREVPLTAPARVSPVVAAARRGLYADAVNESVFMRPGMWLTRALVWLDNRGVDGVVNGTAAALGGSSSRLGRAQTGFVRSYALGMLGGAVLVAGALVAVTTA
ncbi:NADH-quinone oxidoreductase chain L (NADH dehydrogenase I, chain L) (NDH-1, chain L) [Modestobacter italicus]|uniref:NADH-quinone oxidoreductase chain L (NADH dehydrogenase I, chain L) (NDH-1, chain L) n=1 Tax=Modestobacter italicus (strain DSM 44449 / CECT 9708 / BC 501) TaxID=2732864 RepID=I4F3X6_MODI5|nr:NADH-quinone oxidoreductase subunit L [Modestobacter marinus]CCH90339.1 NADH-quinone oxidoreductase chain L (NADH dehydrogenase I, chain L) (NDH-1, chain L) [Modestobacter marinus]